ncbi:MAG: hypothetical protein ACOYK7_07070 [Pirellulales bacterium]
MFDTELYQNPKAPPADTRRKSLREKGRSDCRQQPVGGATGGCLQEQIQRRTSHCGENTPSPFAVNDLGKNQRLLAIPLALEENVHP